MLGGVWLVMVSRTVGRHQLPACPHHAGSFDGTTDECARHRVRDMAEHPLSGFMLLRHGCTCQTALRCLLNVLDQRRALRQAVQLGPGVRPGCQLRGGVPARDDPQHQAQDATSRGRPGRKKAAGLFSLDGYKLRAPIEGVFGAEETRGHQLHCRLVRADNRRRFAKGRPSPGTSGYSTGLSTPTACAYRYRHTAPKRGTRLSRARTDLRR